MALAIKKWSFGNSSGEESTHSTPMKIYCLLCVFPLYFIYKSKEGSCNFTYPVPSQELVLIKLILGLWIKVTCCYWDSHLGGYYLPGDYLYRQTNILLFIHKLWKTTLQCLETTTHATLLRNKMTTDKTT